MSGVLQRHMIVGELSRRTGVPVKNLRRYTGWGLIYSAGRSTTGYRLFDDEAFWCVGLIGELRGLGLTVAEIRDLTHTWYESRPGRRWRGGCASPGRGSRTGSLSCGGRWPAPTPTRPTTRPT
ncbi:MerR family transcriptional regulator [Promicromonospora soli]